MVTPKDGVKQNICKDLNFADPPREKLDFRPLVEETLTSKRIPRGKIRYDGATIDTIAQAHETFLLHESAQDTKDLILAAKIAELARQEHIFAGLPRNPGLDLSPQCLSFRHVRYRAKTRHSQYTKTRQLQRELKRL
ncbi:MAG: hypothetical protein ACR2I2_21795 [Bryobacteraceae bacterium]